LDKLREAEDYRDDVALLDGDLNGLIEESCEARDYLIFVGERCYSPIVNDGVTGKEGGLF